MILMREGRPWVASCLVSIPAAVDVDDWYHCFSSFLENFVLYLTRKLTIKWTIRQACANQLSVR